MSCIEPDKIDELCPPEVATWRASEDLYVKAFSLEATQIDMRYLKRAAENIGFVMDKLSQNAST